MNLPILPIEKDPSRHFSIACVSAEGFGTVFCASLRLVIIIDPVPKDVSGCGVVRGVLDGLLTHSGSAECSVP